MNTPLRKLTANEAETKAFAMLFSLSISFAIFATAIVPASPALFA